MPLSQFVQQGQITGIDVIEAIRVLDAGVLQPLEPGKVHKGTCVA